MSSLAHPLMRQNEYSIITIRISEVISIKCLYQMLASDSCLMLDYVRVINFRIIIIIIIIIN